MSSLTEQIRAARKAAQSNTTAAAKCAALVALDFDAIEAACALTAAATKRATELEAECAQLREALEATEVIVQAEVADPKDPTCRPHAEETLAKLTSALQPKAKKERE